MAFNLLAARDGTNGINTDEGSAMIAVSIVFQTLAVIAVGMRVWAASIIGRKFVAHDYLAFASLLFSLGYFAICIIAVTIGGFGYHITEVSLDGLTVLLKVFYASYYVWITATMLVKLSILQLYISLFITPWFRKVAWGITSVTIAFWASYIIVAIALCQPIKKNWEPTTPGYCGSVVGQEIASATVNMILDFAIAVSPLPVLWKIQTSLEKRFYLIGIVLTGLVICAMNAARIALEATTSTSLDLTYTNSNIALLAGLETWIGIIVCCIPLLGPIFFHGRTGLSKVKPSGASSRRGIFGFRAWSKLSSRGASSYASRPLDAAVVGKDSRNWKASKLDDTMQHSGSFDGMVSQNNRSWVPANAGSAEMHTLNAEGINVETEIRVTKSMV